MPSALGIRPSRAHSRADFAAPARATPFRAREQIDLIQLPVKNEKGNEHVTIPHINLIQLSMLSCRASTSGQAPLPMVLASTSTRCNIRGQRHSRPGDAASRSSGTRVQGSDSRPEAATLRHPRATARVKGQRRSCPVHRE